MADIRTSCPTKLCYLQKSGSAVSVHIHRTSYSVCILTIPLSSQYPGYRPVYSVCIYMYIYLSVYSVSKIQGPTPSPLTQTPSTPKHTNPIQQFSRNRKAVIPSRQKNPTKTKTLPALFFLFLFFSPSVIPINAAFLCYTRQGTPPCPRDASLMQSGRATPGYYLANEKFGGIFNPPSNPLLSS